MKLYNTLKLFYKMKDVVHFNNIEIIDPENNSFYMSGKSFNALFNTNLESIDNIMNFDALASNVINVVPSLEKKKLIIFITGYYFND